MRIERRRLARFAAHRQKKPASRLGCGVEGRALCGIQIGPRFGQLASARPRRRPTPGFRLPIRRRRARTGPKAAPRIFDDRLSEQRPRQRYWRAGVFGVHRQERPKSHAGYYSRRSFRRGPLRFAAILFKPMARKCHGWQDIRACLGSWADLRDRRAVASVWVSLTAVAALSPIPLAILLRAGQDLSHWHPSCQPGGQTALRP